VPAAGEVRARAARGGHEQTPDRQPSTSKPSSTKLALRTPAVLQERGARAPRLFSSALILWKSESRSWKHGQG
jgi:hypothetical protein